jgi:PIN domain nuclease of toxin-antitoxin system
MALEQGQGSVNVHLDTHVALWIAAGERRRLLPVQKRLRRASLFLSPVVIVEMEVLREIGRIRSHVVEVLDILTNDHGVEEAGCDLREIGGYARLLGWTRDPFDRFIVAHAQASRATLLTADETILEHFGDARWRD